MKQFTVTIDRTVHQTRTLIIKAENEYKARADAMKIAKNEEEWTGHDFFVKSDIDIKEATNYYIDRYGNPYDCEDPNACWPAGGGLHKDCEFNADALYAYYVVKSRGKIADYLTTKGFCLLEISDDMERWVKGNTEIEFEDYDLRGCVWGYMHTELIDTD